MCSLTEKAISKDDKRQPQSMSEGKAHSRQPKAVCTSSFLLLAPLLSHLRAERALYTPNKHWETAVQRSPAFVKQLRHDPAPWADPAEVTAQQDTNSVLPAPQAARERPVEAGAAFSTQRPAACPRPHASGAEQGCRGLVSQAMRTSLPLAWAI